jgi:glyoxylase-like metal-dependent hydrolase (beta-lactamase superfamily II)
MMRRADETAAARGTPTRGSRRRKLEDDGVRQTHPAKTAIFPENDAPEEIEAGVWRIPLPMPFALRSVNVYLLRDGPSDWTLIDSGLGLPADEAALRAGLAQAGVALQDITALVLTHAHPDHIGLSGWVAGASDAPVYILVGEDERLYRVWGGEDAETVFAQIEAYSRANGLPEETIAQFRTGNQRLRGILRLPPRERLRILQDDDTLRLGAHTYRALWTPGHSDYHMCLLRDDDLFVAGDHVLPGITPNIGLYPNARPDPLRDYFMGLARVRDLPARIVLPGHRRPFADLAARVDELRAHHEERGERLLGLLARHGEGATAGTLSAALFDRRLTNADDQRFALAETLAHLEYLRAEGRVGCAERDGVFIYHALAPA